MFIRNFLFLLLCVSSTIAFIEKYIEVPIDHFSYTRNDSYKMRYLVNDTYYVDRGPIFFYTGNEGDIKMFAENTGFMFDIAPLYNALLIFAEHRYYGASLPFGNLSYSSPEYLGYLSTEQALADYVYLIDDLQKTYTKNLDVTKLPVILFGGSYGGMLSAWMRMKYPASAIGAISSSAPIWQFQDLTPCENFYRIVTNVFTTFGTSNCSSTIAESWKLFRNLTKTSAGKTEISTMFKLCKPLQNDDDVNTFLGWLGNIYVNLVMVNYPYPTNFLAPLPADPVREFCYKLIDELNSDDKQILQAIAAGLTIYTNYTGKTECNDIKTTSTDLGETGWNFQSCTEMIMPICSDDNDMFETVSWNFNEYSDYCYAAFKVRPARPDVPILKYGGKDLRFASNIVFSNGLMDPWSSGGVLSNVSSKVYAVIIPDGAHHFDLRGANPNDSNSVKEARNFHINMIKNWIDDFYSRVYKTSF